METSLDLIAALLGIWKAGGAYLPMDPGNPTARLTFMLHDSQAPVLLTQHQQLEQLGEYTGTVVYLEDLPIDAIDPAQRCEGTVSLEHPAYIIYTSGSTGQPKGVLASHGNLVQTYQAWEFSYQLQSVRSHLQTANISFDVFSGNLIRAICSGGQLVLCARETLLSPELLYQLIQQERIDCVEFVPAVMRYLVDYLERSGQKMEHIQVLAVGSDTWYGHEYRRLQRSCGAQTRIINSFGVTEATIDSSFFEGGDDLADKAVVPVGKAFAGTQIYILDRHLKPVPIGVPAELYIGGTGVSLGYHNRPELTAERFIPHPFSRQTGGRLYRTGDLARHLPDGNVEFLGRLDQQVKIRGFRVELGEIEGVLRTYSGVQECVTIVQEGSRQEAQLIAYIVPEDKQILQADQDSFVQGVKRHAQKHLPQYMQPGPVLLLPKLPLTPNGKLDRRYLPLPDADKIPASSFVAPGSQSERAIAQVWQEVLCLERVGRDDNFFDLGGHSLLVIEVHSALQARLSTSFSIIDIFKYPTVHTFAQFLHNSTGERVQLEARQDRARLRRNALKGRTGRSQ